MVCQAERESVRERERDGCPSERSLENALCEEVRDHAFHVLIQFCPAGFGTREENRQLERLTRTAELNRRFRLAKEAAKAPLVLDDLGESCEGYRSSNQFTICLSVPQGLVTFV